MSKIIESGTQSAQKNMDIDASLLAGSFYTSALHVYEWERPSITVGHFIRPEEYLNLEALETFHIDLGKRPTGGGIICHFNDFAFSLLFNSEHKFYTMNPLESYHAIHQWIGEIFSNFFPNFSLLPDSKESLYQREIPFCMANPTPYDLIVDGKKMGGAAQRRTKKGLLHQISLSLSLPNFELLQAIIKDQKIVSKIAETTYPIFPNSTEKELYEIKKDLVKILKTNLK